MSATPIDDYGYLAVITGQEIKWWPARVDKSYTDFPVSATQIQAYIQPYAEHDDDFVVEIVTTFTKSLAGTITLDIGTAGSPTAYVAAFDLTQAAGTFGGASPASIVGGLQSLTVDTDIKARVNYLTGALTAGRFFLHVRTARVKP